MKHQEIIRPIITETSMKAAEKGRFSFEVALSATKSMIKKAVEDTFSVHVVHVSTSIQKGRAKRVGPMRREVRISPAKKAIVSLKKGETIGLFGVGDSQENK